MEDIIFHMFQYIQKLRTEGPQEWVFQECKVRYHYQIIFYWLTENNKSLSFEQVHFGLVFHDSES